MRKLPRHPGLVPGSTEQQAAATRVEEWTPEQVRGDGPWKRRIGMAAALALTACGKAAGLAPADGHRLPVAPRGAVATPSPADLITPTVQQRPQRGDELLRSSQERRKDDYDLPPE
jgi:hypothetical protein